MPDSIFGKVQNEIVSRLLALVAVSVLLSPFPALPILYGWYSGNRAGAVPAGSYYTPCRIRGFPWERWI